MAGVKDFTAETLARAMFLHGVPEHLWSGFENYVLHGIPTGAGINRILEHRSVFEVAPGLDEETRANLRNVLAFILDLPQACHGDPAKVQAWINHQGQAGHQ